MADSDEEDHHLVDFVESSMLSGPPDKVGCEEETGEATRPSKRPRIDMDRSHPVRRNQGPPHLPSTTRIESGVFSNIPPEVIHNILKFLSSEDLISCSIVCKFLSYAASDESLWRRLYCMRWGLASASSKLRASAWKNLYIQRDREDMSEFVRNTPSEFKEYYIQMQAAKRSQAPLPSQVNDDHIILDTTVADQVAIWRSSRGFTDESVTGHICSGKTCAYSQIGDVFLCEKTGRVHVCDDTCREAVWDLYSGLMVCTISGQCFDRWLSPEEEADNEQQQAALIDDMEPFMGSGRYARAYSLGYSCIDDKELEAVLRFII
ncbi:F-box protein SKIP31 [Dendrobium catenatum]|uniref:F-box protein SKIP31 n=1 Tax=Dendrobium catenatum TaxID=906689 RepID=UPI0009F31CAD|nr:F-box protein SKIP31 [Dendrobium catenatum]